MQLKSPVSSIILMGSIRLYVLSVVEADMEHGVKMC